MSLRRGFRSHPYARSLPATPRMRGPMAFRAETKPDGDTEIQMYGIVSSEEFYPEDITPAKVNSVLRGAKGNVTLRINSPGGDAYAGVAIYSRLREYCKETGCNVTAKVEGLAASAASIIAMGASTLLMGKGSDLMIHDAWSVAVGNADDMRKASEDLDHLSANMASIYAARSGRSETEMRDLMRAETYLSVGEAMKFKLADGTIVAEDEETTEPEAEDMPPESEPAPDAEGEPAPDAEGEPDEAEGEEDPEAEDGDMTPEDKAAMARGAARAAKSRQASSDRELLLEQNKSLIAPADYKYLLAAPAAEVKGYLRHAKSSGRRYGKPAASQPRQPKAAPAPTTIEITAEQAKMAEERGIKLDSRFAATLAAVKSGSINILRQALQNRKA